MAKTAPHLSDEVFPDVPLMLLILNRAGVCNILAFLAVELAKPITFINTS